MEEYIQKIRIAGLLLSNGKVLMIRNSDELLHTLPSTEIEFGETPEDALIRVFGDETGLLIEPVTPIRVYSETEDNCQYINIHYLVEYADVDDDEIINDADSTQVTWLSATEIGEERTGWNDEIRTSIELVFELNQPEKE